MATWGQQTWGLGSWGTLGNQSIELSSISLTLSPGTVVVDSEINLGWGGATWGNQGWGDLTDTTVDLSGISLSTSIGIITTTAEINAGWGRAEWGSLVWGEAYSVQTGSVSAQTAVGSVSAFTDVSISVQGIALSTAIGDEIPQADAIVTPSGIALTGSIGETQALTIQGTGLSTGVGLVDIQAGGNISIQVDEHTLDTGIGSVIIDIAVEVFQEGIQFNTFIGDEESFTDVVISQAGIALAIAEPEIVVDLNTPVDVTGSSLTTAIGNEEAFTNVIVGVTGISATYAFGDVVIESKYSVDGIPLSGAVNSVTISASALVTPTGIGLTQEVGPFNVIAWAEVDVGTPVVWTPIDLAA